MSKIIIGKAYNSSLKEDTSLITLNNQGLKTSHIGIFGKSGAGKTYTMVSSVFGYIKSSFLEQNGDTFILIDPHNSFLPPLFGLLNDFIPSITENDPKKEQLSSVSLNRAYETIETYEYMKNIQNTHTGNNNLCYKGNIMQKKLNFNPLLCKDLIDDLSLLNIHTNNIVSSLKGCFDWSSFGPKNTSAIEGIVDAFLLFNTLKLRKGDTEGFYSLKDIFLYFDYLQKNKKTPPHIQQAIKEVSQSEYQDIRIKTQMIDQHFLYMEKNIQKDPSYYDTAITKLKVFSYELGDTFGFNSGISDLTLDLQEMMKEQTEMIRIYAFNLADFSMDERKIIIAFLIASSYFYGTRKNHTNPKLAKHYIVVDEFQSFLSIKGEKNPFIDLLEKAFNELRKFSIVYILAYQSVSYELKDLLNNLGVFIIFSLPPEQGTFFLPIINSGSEQELTEKDIANLNRGNFYIVFDTIDIGVQTISGFSGDFMEKNFRNILLSKSEITYEKE
ncbi:DUF87 domain-containing protein [Candidatus Gracilibacteria bacterium]|nr:DUF87 domain-containing protein [Candidatus Gracilibacteria bacterium]